MNKIEYDDAVKHDDIFDNDDITQISKVEVIVLFGIYILSALIAIGSIWFGIIHIYRLFQ